MYMYIHTYVRERVRDCALEVVQDHRDLFGAPI